MSLTGYSNRILRADISSRQNCHWCQHDTIDMLQKNHTVRYCVKSLVTELIFGNTELKPTWDFVKFFMTIYRVSTGSGGQFTPAFSSGGQRILLDHHFDAYEACFTMFGPCTINAIHSVYYAHIKLSLAYPTLAKQSRLLLLASSDAELREPFVTKTLVQNCTLFGIKKVTPPAPTHSTAAPVHHHFQISSAVNVHFLSPDEQSVKAA